MKEFIRDDGWRVTVTHVDIDHVTFHQAGGGLQLKSPTESFYQHYRLAPPPVIRRGTVTADFLGPDEVERLALPCWSDGQLWNGWSMPAFEKAEVDKLIEMGVGPLEWSGNNLTCRMGGDPEDFEVYEMWALPDGTRVWPVGAGSWCWDQIKFEGDEV